MPSTEETFGARVSEKVADKLSSLFLAFSLLSDFQT